jgi:predicted ester cyclase
MEEMLEKAVPSIAQQNMQDYVQTHDVKYVAEDGVFKNMDTGEAHKGRTEIGAMLHYMYHVAFDASAEVTNLVVTENKALLEALFKGTHIGEIAGIAATNKKVNVPFCVCYDLEGGLIKEARIYMSLNVLLQQLNA